MYFVVIDSADYNIVNVVKWITFMNRQSFAKYITIESNVIYSELFVHVFV